MSHTIPLVPIDDAKPGLPAGVTFEDIPLSDDDVAALTAEVSEIPDVDGR